MAVDPLNVPPSLRPWHRAGVEFLLAEQPLPAPYSLCIAPPPASAQRPASTPQHAGRPPVMQGPRPAMPPRTAAQNAAPPPPQEAAHSAGQRPSGQSPPPHAPTAPSRPARPMASTAPAPAPAAVPPLALLPADQWPALWQERLRKTAPAAVLWTYWALGEDMCVRPNPQRRALLQRLLGDLGHPAGTHSFWPAAMPAAMPVDSAMTDSENPQESSLQANAAVFWSGVHALKARALVVMGSPAIKALNLPPRLRPFQQTRHNGRLVIVLRDVDFLAQETHRYDAVKEFLKQALAPFGR